MKTMRGGMLLMAIMGPAFVLAQAVPAVAKPGAEITKFASLLVGTWTYEATAKANPYGPAGKVTGTDVFEAGPGGHSVYHKWDEKNPVAPTTGLEVIAWDAMKKALVDSYYSSLGEVGSGSLSIAGSVYTFNTSGTTYEGKQGWSKCDWNLTNPRSMKVSCDASGDRKTWSKAVFTGTWTRK